MTTATNSSWDTKRTAETRMIEDSLKTHFDQVDAYRYNSACIRLRVIDARFEQLAREKRDAMVEIFIEKLPAETQTDIVTLFTFSPKELVQQEASFREFMFNSEFEDPSPTLL